MNITGLLVPTYRNAGERPGTLAEARGRIDQALAYVNSLGANALDTAPEDDPIVLDLPMGMTSTSPGRNSPATGRSANSIST
jgi:hypothetical protein